MTADRIVFREESHQIIGACFEVINYLKATGMQLGLLANFEPYPKSEHERFVNQPLSRLSQFLHQGVQKVGAVDACTPRH